MLYVNEITVINEEKLTTFLQTYIQNNQTHFSELLNLIDNNIKFYHEVVQEKATLCENVSRSFGGISNILECNDTTIDLFKDGINYTFAIENEVLRDVAISDTTFEAMIRERLANSIITQNTTFTLIENILEMKYEVEVVEENVEAKMLINERFRIYLSTTATSITKINDTTFEVIFPLKEIVLKGTYDLDTHTISRIAYVIPNVANTLSIRDLALPLGEADKEILAYLANNPKLYLRQYNMDAFDKYESIVNKR